MGALSGGAGGGGFMNNPLVGGAMGGLKYWGVDRPRENRQRNLAATTAYYSPWTGMKVSEVGGLPEEGSFYENVMKGMGGTAAGQGR